MGDIDVRVLSEDDWQAFRAVRLAALKESPEAFVASYDEEAGYDEARWRQRMLKSKRLLATVGDDVVGVASVGQSSEKPSAAELFGLWVTPVARGTGVATALVQAGADVALADGRSHLAYWVGTDNGRAVAFASGFGFRPGDSRRPVRVRNGSDDEEIVMVIALGADRGQPTPF
jgi:predicted GNAT family acetyltransferase